MSLRRPPSPVHLLSTTARAAGHSTAQRSERAHAGGCGHPASFATPLATHWQFVMMTSWLLMASAALTAA